MTDEQKYLDLAKFFIDERGKEPHYFTEEAIKDGRDPNDFSFSTYEYNQSHRPVRQQDKVVGHAVRATYMYSGMADLATEFADDSLTNVLETLWDDLTTKQMYITGGIGPSQANEGFTEHYDLPNDTAYAETCASVALVFWASRMLGRGPNARFADIMEQALYNGALTGLAQNGETFFYDNPLESTGQHHRWKWHSCPCCPPNISRLISSIGSYLYSVAEEEIAVHLFCDNEADLELTCGKINLKQSTNYPWEGAISIEVTPEKATEFAVSVRIPNWAKSASLKVNDEEVHIEESVENGYVRIERAWSSSDQILRNLPLNLRPQYAHPNVRHNAGRVA